SSASAAAAAAAAALAAGAADGPTNDEAPGADGRRSYINLPAHHSAIIQQWVLDAGSGSILGHVNGGFLPNPVAAHSGSEFALASTSFSRIAKGKRTDYVEVFDPVTFLPIADIELPDAPRFDVGPYSWMNANTPNNADLLFFQFAAGPAVGLVVQGGSSDDQLLSSPTCYHIHPGAPSTFYLLCAQGGLAKTDHAGGAAGAGLVGAMLTAAQNLLTQPAQANKSGRIVWPVYSGKILQADISAAGATNKAPIDALSGGRKADTWRPGGWQQVAYLKSSDGIYLLTSEQSAWKLHAAAKEVTSVTGLVGQTSSQISLGHDVDAISVAQDGGPDLYALSAGTEVLHIYDAGAGDQDQSTVELGSGPQVLSVMNEA
uniref:METHYLAMINE DEHYDROGENASE (HEAVY SUBUNIT) n=1 Tax=Paracoccus versutus TaxID=34007 RepID=UPI000011257F|nr:Chain H, Methylamine Dehydrogenase (heavy Subunit) [Paracoccus versutus]1MAF_H Chain H, Methylamine Dehydrogenase (heavy Subunit) [Paracoccus versutus]2MAD_H Chain H, METHYLAMINE DEHYDROGENASE (HEAVY SUBUNIT) [Paracoccus versutus]